MIDRYNRLRWLTQFQSHQMRFLIAFLLVITPACVEAANEQSQPSSLVPTMPSSSTGDTRYGAPRKLTLQQCFDQADANNKEILIAATKLSIAQSAIVIAKAIPNPIYNMTYGWGPAWDYIVAGNNQQVGISEEIQVAGRFTKKVSLAASSFLQTALQVEATRFEIHNRVRRAYATLAASTSWARLVNAQRHNAEELLHISNSQNEKNADKAKLLQANFVVLQLEAQHNLAGGKLVQDSAQLAQLLGETPDQEEVISVEDDEIFNLSAQRNNIVPGPARGVPPLEKLLPAAWLLRNDLKAAIQQAYSNRKALTLAKTQRIPDPVIGANFLFTAYNRQQPQDFNPTGSGIIGDPGNRVPQQPAFLLTLSEETPLFYQYQGQVDQAKLTWEHQLKQNDAQKAQIANDIVVAYATLILARKNIEKFQAVLLPESLNVAKLSQQGYKTGTTEFDTAVLAQRQYQQLRATYFNCVVAYQNAWADLEKAVGVPLVL
jgi:outer membrane protein, heavy metal efflux system